MPQVTPQGTADGVRLYSLSDLLLDYSNPRLGSKATTNNRQEDILDMIVEQFGVDELLSSMAVNGYFSAEPLVGKEDESNSGKIIIADGNRRLAACLVLSGDTRAKNHKRITRTYQEIQDKRRIPRIVEVPVIVKTEGELLAYLGVRHIASSQPWDSFAKAAWIAKLLDSNKYTIDDIAEMIGDKHQTVSKMLEGFRFMKQLESTSRYSPDDSEKNGRGSNSSYPFSWVYTALGFSNIRNWLGLDDKGSEPRSYPIKEEKLERSSDLVKFMFGCKSENKEPVLNDSREIATLARLITDDRIYSRLKEGRKLSEVEDLAKPAEDRARLLLVTARDSLGGVSAIIAESEIDSTLAENLLESIRPVKKLAQNIFKDLYKKVHPDDDDSE